MRPFAFAFLLAVLALPARAEPVFDARFEVRLLGLPIGALAVTRADDGAGNYAAEGRFATTGVAGILARVGFEMRSRGRVRMTGLEPRDYAERMDTGERAGRTGATFRPGDRRLDPLAALLMGLAPRPVTASCAMDREVFDGSRTHRLILIERRRNPEEIVCAGEFRRVAGYTPGELARRSGYPITVIYRVAGGRMEVDRAYSSSGFGPISVLRIGEAEP